MSQKKYQRFKHLGCPEPSSSRSPAKTMAEKYTPPESFVNPQWPHDPRHDARDGSLLAFSHETLLAYFRESPFYDKGCVNEMCRVQALPVDIILECVRRACGLMCVPMCLVHCVCV